MTEIELYKIVNLKELLSIPNLKIPDYQRPYTWSIDSVNTLFTDILEACKDKKENNLYDYEYRLGTVVIHKDKDEYNIVDGQQRITTIVMLLKILNEKNKSNYFDLENLLNIEYSSLSIANIKRNYNVLLSNVNSLKDIEGYKEFLLNHCTFVKIELEEQSEAFQFFDSQNARGKDLEPHDLLKAYHLREMNDIDKKITNEVIKKWENNYQEIDLKNFFNDNLYPLIRWYKGKDGLYFDKSKIKYFKGIKEKDKYNYALYHKFFHEYINKTNKGFGKLLFGKYELFQLTQELLAGEKFFEYVFYYDNLAKRVDKLINEYNEKWIKEFDQKLNEKEIIDVIPSKGSGDKYIRNLLKNMLIFWADKFGFDEIKENVFNKLFCFAYKIRIGQQVVFYKTPNKYALSDHDLNNEINIFEFINNMKYPKEINTIYIEKPQTKGGDKGKYRRLYIKIEELCGWE